MVLSFSVALEAVSFSVRQKRLNLSSLDSRHEKYNRVLLNFTSKRWALSRVKGSRNVYNAYICRSISNVSAA